MKLDKIEYFIIILVGIFKTVAEIIAYSGVVLK